MYLAKESLSVTDFDLNLSIVSHPCSHKEELGHIREACRPAHTGEKGRDENGIEPDMEEASEADSELELLAICTR